MIRTGENARGMKGQFALIVPIFKEKRDTQVCGNSIGIKKISHMAQLVLASMITPRQHTCKN